MDQAWKSINGFIVSFMSSFDQWKILFYTEITKKRKSHPWKLSITIEKECIQSILALQTPHYYGHSVNANKSQSPWRNV